MSATSIPPAYPLVVQHNALINAQFNLSTTESRLFLAMLSRIAPQDTEFAKCQVEMHHILDPASNNYAHVRKVLDSFGGRKLRMEKLNPDGRRRQKRTFTVIPLVEYAEYREGEGFVEAQFNSRLLPYLLELRDNFTKAQLVELIKLKSSNSFRIYWLLREQASFGKRVISLEDLKMTLGLTKEYDRFNNFKVRVLDKAQEELAVTDTPFNYKTIKSGREVVAIEFRLRLEDVPAREPAVAEHLLEWEEEVLAAGVASSSMPQIKSRLAAGDYEVGYVRYVLETVKKQAQNGKIKHEGGAVFKALVDGYLLPAYRKEHQRRDTLPSKPKVKSSSAVANQLKKLNSELEDARNSLRFVQTAVIYTDETRPAALLEVQGRIAQLEQQRHLLTA